MKKDNLDLKYIKEYYSREIINCARRVVSFVI